MAKKNLFKDQSGAVALITVILLMFVFLVVTLGFLRIAISEQRQASDTDLNSRAYYAAESGIEDARRILNQLNADGVLSATDITSLNGDSCDVALEAGQTVPDPVLSADLNTEITCQLIDLSPGEFVAAQKVNQPVFIPLKPEDGLPIQRVEIEWHENETDDPAVARDQGNTSIPNLGCWNSTEASGCGGNSRYPAMMRIGLFSHPRNGNITRTDIENRLGYFSPANSTGNMDISGFDAVAGVNSLKTNADCSDDAARTYFCSLRITGLLGSRTYYLRLTPLYRDASIRVKMFRGSNPQGFAGTQAKIDVTAKAGDVVRRIEARIPLESNDLLPDDVLTTADDLCKDLRIVGIDRRGVDGCND